jgi:hypothetical protein
MARRDVSISILVKTANCSLVGDGLPNIEQPVQGSATRVNISPARTVSTHGGSMPAREKQAVPRPKIHFCFIFMGVCLSQNSSPLERHQDLALGHQGISGPFKK